MVLFQVNDILAPASGVLLSDWKVSDKYHKASNGYGFSLTALTGWVSGKRYRRCDPKVGFARVRIWLRYLLNNFSVHFIF